MGSLVSIDGPTASGKTTLGTALACGLSAAFLDTGLTFRAAAYACFVDTLHASVHDLTELIVHEPRFLRPGDVDTPRRFDQARLWYKGHDISDQIWHPQLDPSLAAVASTIEWRKQILEIHRGLVACSERIVVVGRDVAATLMPMATCSVYLTASLVVRRERRRAQYRSRSDRSIAVGPESARDIQCCDIIRQRESGLFIDSTFLPAVAVLAAVRSSIVGD